MLLPFFIPFCSQWGGSIIARKHPHREKPLAQSRTPGPITYAQSSGAAEWREMPGDSSVGKPKSTVCQLGKLNMERVKLPMVDG